MDTTRVNEDRDESNKNNIIVVSIPILILTGCRNNHQLKTAKRKRCLSYHIEACNTVDGEISSGMW